MLCQFHNADAMVAIVSLREQRSQMASRLRFRTRSLVAWENGPRGDLETRTLRSHRQVGLIKNAWLEVASQLCWASAVAHPLSVISTPLSAWFITAATLPFTPVFSSFPLLQISPSTCDFSPTVSMAFALSQLPCHQTAADRRRPATAFYDLGLSLSLDDSPNGLHSPATPPLARSYVNPFTSSALPSGGGGGGLSLGHPIDLHTDDMATRNRAAEYDLSLNFNALSLADSASTSPASSESGYRSEEGRWPRDALPSGWDAFKDFVHTASRVIRISGAALPSVSSVLCRFPVDPLLIDGKEIRKPTKAFELRNEYAEYKPATERDNVWVLFDNHKQAFAALWFLAVDVDVAHHVFPALDADISLEHAFHVLSFDSSMMPQMRNPPFRVADPPSPTNSLPPPSPARFQHVNPLRTSFSASDLRARYYQERLMQSDASQMPGYTLSSNPPNPRSNFRLGDWICPMPGCDYHNFQRNLQCMGCGSPRPMEAVPSPLQAPPSPWGPQNRVPSSPRFTSTPNLHVGPSREPYSPLSAPSSLNPAFNLQGRPPIHTTASLPAAPKSSSTLLTPSGRALAIGGRVQNISSDPRLPCLMWWPDNEPLPEQGQIRPPEVIGIQHPPILNTGNRGPIEHQPGDWICQKCSYLNWRRRKICQTCFPYAEGNGDSISAAVQAERIALLASVIAKEGQSPAASLPRLVVPDSRPVVLPSHQERSPLSRTFACRPQDVSSLSPDSELGYSECRPIYQTSGNRQPSAPNYYAKPAVAQNAKTPTPLLPSFLQDMVRSPSLSPSTSSAPSPEGSDDGVQFSPGGVRSSPRSALSNVSLSNVPGGSIWKMDGEESRVLSAQERIPGFGRIPTRDILTRV